MIGITENLPRSCGLRVKSNSILNAECGPLFVCDLESAEIAAVREHLKQEKEWNTPKLISPPPSDRVDSDLQKVELGEIAYWVQLTLDLTLEPTSSHYAADAGPDLTEMPGWKAADDGTRRRIVEAGVRYLTDGDPKNDEWFQTKSIPYSAIGGFCALALLMITEDTRLDSLSETRLAQVGADPAQIARPERQAEIEIAPVKART